MKGLLRKNLFGKNRHVKGNSEILHRTVMAVKCLMSPCCGLEAFKIKVVLCVSVKEETHGPHYKYQPAVFCFPYASQKQEHLSIALTALCTVACNLYNFIFVLGIHTQYLIWIEKSVLCTPDWLVLYF